MTAVTHDSISLRGAGIVTVLQPENGFRFTQDSILLADFCRIKPHDRVLELGAGTGVISLLLAKKFPTARFAADEFEPEAYRLLTHNIDANGFRERIIPVDRDVKYLSRSIAPGAFDVIVANPPYNKEGTGRTSPSVVRQSARQDRAAPLPVWLNRHDLLKNRGRFFLVFSAHRAGELICLLRERTLEPKRLRFVHPFQDKPASLLLLEAVKAGGTGLEVLPPLIVHGPGGEYSQEMTDIYGSTP